MPPRAATWAESRQLGIGSGYSDKPRIDAAYSLAHHIADLIDFLTWMAQVCDGLEAEDFAWTLERTPRPAPAA